MTTLTDNNTDHTDTLIIYTRRYLFFFFWKTRSYISYVRLDIFLLFLIIQLFLNYL